MKVENVRRVLFHSKIPDLLLLPSINFYLDAYADAILFIYVNGGFPYFTTFDRFHSFLTIHTTRRIFPYSSFIQQMLTSSKTATSL
jgi:hypothetical protein